VEIRGRAASTLGNRGLGPLNHDGIAHSACQEERRYPLRRRAIDSAPFLSLATGMASRSSSALRTDGLSEIAPVVGFSGAHIIFQVQPLSRSNSLSMQ
jgi:hypothetical protein